MAKTQFKFEVTLNVADCWIADSFNPQPQDIQRVIEGSFLPYRYAGELEVTVKTLSRPTEKQLQAAEDRHVAAIEGPQA